MRINQKAEKKMCLAKPKTRKIYGPQEVHKSKRACAFSLITVRPTVITKMPININQFSHT